MGFGGVCVCGGGLKCDLLNSLGGQRGVRCFTYLTDAPLLLLFKLLISVERLNTSSCFPAKVKKTEGMGD